MVTTRSQPPALVIFKIIYWGTVIGLAIAVVLNAPDEFREWLFEELVKERRRNPSEHEGGPGLFVILVCGFYAIAAAAVYRLLLLFVSLAIESDALMQEIKDSEGRIELDLTDRKHR